MAKNNPPTAAATPEVAQAPQVEAVVADAVAAGPSNVQPSVVPGGPTVGPTQPTPGPQPLFPAPNPQNQPPQGNPGVGALGNIRAPPPGSCGFQGVHQGNRYRGRGGRNRYFPRGPRWGGNTQPRHPSAANVSSGGNGGYQGNNRRQWDSVRCVNCGLQYASWVKTCSLCNSVVR